MRRFHIAISTHDLDASVADYSRRLDTEPLLEVPGEYALWRTPTLNVSVRRDPELPAGTVRHLGFEDPAADGFSEEIDVNGILWERFRAEDQATEIRRRWPIDDEPR